MTKDTRKTVVTDLINALPLTEILDVCEYYFAFHGIGYRELRYIWVNEFGEPCFESNNVHDPNSETGEDYMVFYWNDLTDYEKLEVERILAQLAVTLNDPGFVHGIPDRLQERGVNYIIYKERDGRKFFYAPARSRETAERIARAYPSHGVRCVAQDAQSNHIH